MVIRRRLWLLWDILQPCSMQASARGFKYGPTSCHCSTPQRKMRQTNWFFSSSVRQSRVASDQDGLLFSFYGLGGSLANRGEFVNEARRGQHILPLTALSSRYTTTMQQQNWYQQLNKPSWAPDEKVFGQVWSVLYPIIFAVNVYVLVLLYQNKISWLVALPFWLNLFFNFLFTPIQFGLKNNLLASIDIILVLATIVWAMIAIWPHAKIAALAFVPYFIWVTIATVLQLSILFKN